MNRQYIDDQHVIARYLADQLREDERLEFETYCLAHPEILNAIEQAARLKVGLATLRQTGRLDELLAPRPALASAAMTRFAAAAVVVLALGVAWFAFLGPTTPSGPRVMAATIAEVGPAGTVLPSFAVGRIERTRGTQTERALPETRSAIALPIAPAAAVPGMHYDVTLRRRDGDTAVQVAAVRNLTATDAGSVTVVIDSSALETDVIYEFIVSASGSNAQESFNVRWVRAVAP